MKKVIMQNATALKRALRRLRMVPPAFFVLLVRGYQLTLSPAKTALFGPSGHCRFEPSCSQYAIEALKTHGVVTGGWLAAKRVCRCHPWGACGEDPVPAKKLNSPQFDFPTPRAAFRVSRS